MGNDPPADVDPSEFAPDSARTIQCDAIPEAVEVDTPRPETTGRHRLTPAQFASGVELAEQDGYRRGFQQGETAGFARGLAAGRAAVRADDWDAGVEDALAGLRVYLAGQGIVHGDEFARAVRAYVKRSG